MSAAFGVGCGLCGGPVYMETCGLNGGTEGCEWAVASECQRCGARFPIACPDHSAPVASEGGPE